MVIPKEIIIYRWSLFWKYLAFLEILLISFVYASQYFCSYGLLLFCNSLNLKILRILRCTNEFLDICLTYFWFWRNIWCSFPCVFSHILWLFRYKGKSLFEMLNRYVEMMRLHLLWYWYLLNCSKCWAHLLCQSAEG